MATKQFNSRIQLKKDTSANWTANNPVLLNGEIAIVVTNSGETRFKIGDGTSAYTALPFQDEAVRALITAADDKIDAHITDTDNPHEVTKAQIGLSNVDNVKQFSANNPPPYPVTSVNGNTGAVNLTAEDVNALPITGGTISGDLAVKNPEGSIKIQFSTDYAGFLSVALMNFSNSQIGGSLLSDTEGMYVVGLSEPLSNIQQAFQTVVGMIVAGDSLAPVFGLPSGITMKGPINFAGNKLSLVGEPQISTDAATMGFVQNSLSNIVEGVEPLPYLSDNGGTLTGTLNMGNNKITMGATPTAITDVTNKGYVDGVVKVVSDEVDGIIAGTTSISVPAATEAKIGGIKPGAGTAVSGDGTLTIIVPVPTAEDNGKILVAENGTYVLKTLAEIQGG